jgi:hypothetical protein
VITKTTIALRSTFYVGKYALRHQENLWPILKAYRYYNSKIRISAAALLCLEEDDKYVLVQNHHRPEQFAPFGGVYKHDDPAPKILDTIEWEPDYTSHQPKLEDMRGDLRGLVYGKHFATFLDWFTKGEGREGERCIDREIREELLEGRVGKSIRDEATKMKLSLVRRVVEGPNSVEGRTYAAQFRFFEVFRPQRSDALTQRISDLLFERAQKGDNNMLLVTRKEIEASRTSDGKNPIGAHAQYFFSSRWHGVEPARY